MADVEAFDVPMELGLELGAVVRLNHVNAERQPAHDFIDELNRRPLVAGVVHLEHPKARAVVDRGELIQALLGAGNALKELHVQLETVPWLRLLVAFPAHPVRPVLQIGR